MSLFADALQPFVLSHLSSVTGRLGLKTLPDTLVEPLAAYDLNFDDVHEAIVVDFRASEPVALALAADACRLSCASFQTVSLAVNEMLHRDGMAWSLVKLYYAAFYAGNALLRLFGESCSYFDRRHALRVRQLADALGRTPQFAIEVGLYQCIVDQSGTWFSSRKIRAGAGGAHEAFWLVFGSKMQAVGEAVLQGGILQTDAQSVFVQLEQFRLMLARRTGFAWLSALRNEIQYRHEHRVWFPEQLRTRERERLSRRAAEWQNDPMSIRLDEGNTALEEFISCCAFTVALSYTMLARVAERSTAGPRSFIRVGPLAFINDRAA